MNDFLLAVEGEGTAAEAPFLLRITSVSVDKSANTTTIEWQDVNGEYQQASKQVSLYVFGVIAAPFGDAAPRYDTLPPGLTNSGRQDSKRSVSGQLGFALKGAVYRGRCCSNHDSRSQSDVLRAIARRPGEPVVS